MKKSHRKKIIFLVLALAMTVPISCKKDPIKYVFKGQLTDLLTGGAVQGVDVIVSQLVFNNTSSSVNYTNVADLVSNSSGDYSVTFDREKVSDFRIELSDSRYFYQENIINPSSVTTENDNVFNYVIEPKAWIKFQFTNFSPLLTDNLTLVLQNFKANCSECASDDFLYFPGAVDTVLKFTTTAGEFAKFIYIDEANGTNTADSIYVIPFDTVTYSFNY